MPKTLSSVVLVGRPNVGKSTLFNRLTQSRRAIVTEIPGTTRDVITHPVEWQGARFELIDTGGMFGASQDPLHQLVLERGQRAIKDAELLILVVDGREGLVPADVDIAEVVRKANIPTLLAINKTDDRRSRAGVMELYQLGFDPAFEVSAEHGEGIGELLDAITERTAHVGSGDEETAHEQSELAVAIVGRPNAGKSSLVNRLLREERMLVSDMPGTTRDAVDTLLTWHRRTFRIVDTAGIRRPGRVIKGGKPEEVSVLLARRAIKRADVVVLVVDATAGATDQDGAIAGEAEGAGSGVIIAANKWDLMKPPGTNSNEFDENLRRQLKFLEYAPLLHISAETGERTSRLFEVIDRVAGNCRKRIPTPAFNQFLAQVTTRHPPVSPGRRRVRILYGTQIGIAPPTFLLFTNVATKFHFSYERFLINQLREAFGFEGAPIQLRVRRRRGKTA